LAREKRYYYLLMDFILALGYFVGLAAVFLWKLIPVWNSAIPGGLEDTRLFLWNAWWFHYAVTALHTNPFHTMMLFHPFGASLISHDFPLWMSLVTFIGQRQGLSMIAASNVWFALSWMLAGFCTYGLAREVTGRPAAAIVAGTYVMTHSYLLARAMQNWGQFNLYGIPLFLWALLRARRRENAASFALAGVALAWTAACHFYFLIYSVLLWLAVAVQDLFPYTFRFGKKASSAPWLLGVSVIAGLAALGITLHPEIYHIAGQTLRMQSPQNVLFVMWMSLIIWGTTHIRVELMDPPPVTAGDDVKNNLLNHVILVASASALLSPLFWETFKLIMAGGYPKQSILWKTHNAGANLFALFMPNPLHAIWGPAVSAWYTVRGMQPQDQAASIGWVCLAVVIGSGVWKESSSARRWLWLAIAATILSMGTHLHLAQYNLWCPLPFFFLRLLPILGNVRIPERWMAVGAVAWSVVLAKAVVKMESQIENRKSKIAKPFILVTALILLENWPGVPYAAVPPVSPVYEHLRQLPEGAVLTVPIYIGDSSIGTGNAINGQFVFPWDHLWAQIAHQKPILGGYIGRISRKLIEDYKADPFIHHLLDLEEGKIQSQDPEPAYGSYSVKNLNFSYLLLYPASTTPDVVTYVKGSLPLELVDQDASIQLYKIKQ